MKKLFFEISIIIMMVLVPFTANASGKGAIGTDEHLVLAIIIDCSDVGHITWRQSLILARQAISLLGAGDELIIVSAHKDKNVIETICRIDPDSAAQRTRLNQKLMDLKYKWWCRANIADALQLAYGELNNRPYTSKYCLVISDGRYSDWKVADIRHKAAVCKLSGVNLLMTVAETANPNLLLAGDRDEFDIAIIENSDIAGWFEKFRTYQVPIEQAIDSKTQKPLPPLSDDKKLDEAELTKPPVHDIDNSKTEELKAKERSKEGGKKNIRKRSKMIWPAIAILVIFGAMSLIVFSKGKSATNSKATDQTDDNMPFHLIAFYGDHKYDLGSLDALGEILIGSGLGSTIYIDDETVEDKHVRIFKSRRELKIQNLACSPIIINGLELTHRRKSVLDLPVDIELVNEVTITVLSEPLESDKELNSDENKTI
ncbi:hypothetical protein ACFL3G_01895 [Planctomycetota bacterium]